MGLEEAEGGGGRETSPSSSAKRVCRRLRSDGRSQRRIYETLENEPRNSFTQRAGRLVGFRTIQVFFFLLPFLNVLVGRRGGRGVWSEE